MNILYFIHSGGNASGGHFHSLDQVSKEVGKKHKTGIVSLGRNPSPVLSKNPFFLKHYFLNGGISRLFSLNQALRKTIKDFRPDVLHCFDTSSLNKILLMPATFGIPIVLNKCGGPNPRRRNYQHANAMVVFSAENHEWFVNNPNYKKETIHLIPNRVEQLRFLPEQQRREKKEKGKITFLRVTRIGGAYEKTLSDTFRMIEELKSSFPVKLIVVGKIQDKGRYLWFREQVKQRKLPVEFITDERAGKGADFLYLADFAIGTGRSFMEALSLGIPTLTPAKNADWPVLVNTQNFNSFFKTNFSERNQAPKEVLGTNKEKVIRLIEDREAFQKAKAEAESLFRENFGTTQLFEKYDKVYQLTKNGNAGRPGLLLKNLPYILKSLI